MAARTWEAYPPPPPLLDLGFVAVDVVRELEELLPLLLLLRVVELDERWVDEDRAGWLAEYELWACARWAASRASRSLRAFSLAMRFCSALYSLLDFFASASTFSTSVFVRSKVFSEGLPVTTFSASSRRPVNFSS